MGSFFIKKISDLRVSLDPTENLCSTVNRHSSHFSSSFTAFRSFDMDSFMKLLLGAPTKPCALDPVPTNILKDCGLDKLLLTLSTTINKLVVWIWIFPWHLETDVTPLLKKKKVLTWFIKTLDQSEIFSFVSKLAEKVAAEQIQSYLNEHDLFPWLQSAYRQHHSTGTVLLKVKNDILLTIGFSWIASSLILEFQASIDNTATRLQNTSIDCSADSP